MRRCSAIAALVLLGVVLGATPAAADPARPSNYRSEVEVVEPDTSAIDVRVVGGDAFLKLEVDPGVEALVPGYQGEPYLRFDADGGVWANVRSPAHHLNEDRFGQVALPDSVDAGAEPEWQQVGDGGTHGWHDHRIHWMSPDPPPGVVRQQSTEIQRWEIPIGVAGDHVVVRGTLEWVPSKSPLPWIMVFLALTWVLVTPRVRAAIAPGWAVVGGAAVAALVGIAQAWSSPLPLWEETAAWAPPLVALASGAMALGQGYRARYLLAVGGTLLAVWAGGRTTALWLPVLPTELPEPLERAAVVLAAASAVSAAIAVWERLRVEG